ncbi:MAG: homoserine dehydrogenase [Promethearchaeota archaeon]|jgi:homoserine dehydrogenase
MDIKICLIGKGIVGTSFLELLNEKEEEFSQKFNLRFIVNSIYEHDGALINEDGISLSEILEHRDDYRILPYWKNNIEPIESLSKSKINICIETTPTNPNTGEPGFSHIIEAINNKIDVISSNKGPFYLHYDKIKKLAKEHQCYVKYEPTVASCVPILSIKENLSGNKIEKIKAILNGTSNFILSRMTAEGVNFDLALKEAQELGYAESDPTLDIEGYDAAGKLVILANNLLGWSKSITDVKIEGISKITPQAIELAKSDGLVIKHLAIAQNNDLIVGPRLVDKYSPLNVSGNLNIIELETKHAGPIILMGRGAGGYEAASAIINDLIDIAVKRGYIKNNYL